MSNLSDLPPDVGDQARLRQSPRSNEAEQSVLGALFLDPQAFEAIPTLKAADFYDAAHRSVYAVMQREALAHRATDVVSVFVALQAIGEADRCGGLEYLNALAEGVASARSIATHAGLIVERARQRAIIAAVSACEAVAWGEGSAGEKADKIAALMAGLQHQHAGKGPRSIVDIAIERTGYYEDLQAGRVAAGWPTRIPSLDDMLTGGLRPGGLYIIAARPKVGKSSFAQTLGLTMAAAGLPTLFLSQEMSAGEIADRAVANVGRVNYSALLAGKMQPDDWHRASEALETLRESTLFVDDQGGLTLMDIKAKARTVRGLKVLVVDYLQLCASALSGENRNAQIEEITRGLKALAKEMGIAVVALSQLNRKVEERSSKRPQLSDLRDSGAIEQDADAVLFLWPFRDHPAEGRKIVGLAVEANRQGRCGHFGLDFRGATQHWGESTTSVDAPEPTKATRHTGGYE